MNSAWLPMLIATVGYTGYHVLQKNVPAETSPLLATAIAYAVGLVGCLLALTLTGGWATVKSGQFTNLPTLGVGIAIIAIEMGFLLAYRGGGSLGSTALWVSSLANLLLFVGAVAWGMDKLDLSRVLGVAFSLVGLILLARE
jgi:drug/metabolite transporter (DMT)-like permease